MQGHPQVIQHLNALLTGELTAIDQYLAHSRMYRDWGFIKLHEKTEHEMLEEQEHAGALIDRILFLEGKPNLDKRDALNIGKDVQDMLRNDLALEYRVVEHLREVIAFCESVRDFVTRDILLKLLKDTEEDHAWWLEQQLRLIDNIGSANYLQARL